ncbi:MAG TPA: biopolymer transporter ExbD [Tepidisphaeraceae bacterium]|jgi:biopolymer transport protein ExbD
MPVKLDAKAPSDLAEARIEIIPLIDIMFFLLAAFMLVSLSMVNLKTMKVNLPTATSATNEPKRDFVDISVDKAGSAYLNKRAIDDNQLIGQLAGFQKANPDVRIIISADNDARHGDVIHVLDLVRLAGVEKVAFEIRPPGKEAMP